MALISYFTAKKNGAKNSTAAMTAAAAGLGTYYVATETKWGKSATSWLSEKWQNLVGTDGQPVTNSDGSTATAPPGAQVVLNPATGLPEKDGSGNVVWKLLDTAGNAVSTTGGVLKSWGPTGTAAVIGTAAVATGSFDIKKWLPIIGLGLLAYMVVK